MPIRAVHIKSMYLQQQWSTALDNDTMNEKHVIHKTKMTLLKKRGCGRTKT
jgi:hypothetical protein